MTRASTPGAVGAAPRLMRHCGRWLFFAWMASGLTSSGVCAVREASAWLPTNTLAVLTIPDWGRARLAFEQHPWVRTWQCPEMLEFRSRLEGQIRTNVWRPLEEEWGLRLPEWLDRIEGQVTFALIARPASNPGQDSHFSWMLLADCGAQAGSAATALGQWERHWRDHQRPLETRRLLDCDFVEVRPGGEVASTGTEPAAGTVFIGLVGTALLLGNDESALREALPRVRGETRPALGDLPLFQRDWTHRLASSQAWIWINGGETFLAILGPGANQAGAAKGGFGPDPRRIARAAGLANLQSVCLTLRSDGEGTRGEVFLGVPAGQRAGLFKVLVAGDKDASPPPFVPSDVVRFRRWRLNVPEAWKAFEVAFGRAMPQAAGLMGLIFESLGKDRDPKIELRADLLRLIGDDLIACEFSPAMKPPAPLYALPSVVLVASPNPEQLATTVAKTLISLPFTPQTVETQQVGNLGVYSLRVPGTGTNEIPPVTLQWGPWSNWLAFSTRTGLLERLRPTAGARLVDAPGLEEATREVGGSEHGVFGYTDVRQLVGFTWTRFKQNPNNLDRWIDRSGLETFFPENAKEWRNWVDVTLLPPFESVERWFGFTVLNQVLTDDGIALRFLTPTPGREAGPNPAKPAEATATP